MKYDLHVHINPHASEGEIYEYDLYSKMNGMDIVGFVIHYDSRMPERLLRDFRDVVSTFSVRSLAGLEIYHPARKIPRGFDFYLIHFSNVAIDPDVASRYEEIVIAHPFAYGARVSDEALPLLRKRNIGVEYNSAHHTGKLDDFYRRCREAGVDITFGSDAHSPQEIGAGFEEARGIISDFQSLRVLRWKI